MHANGDEKRQTELAADKELPHREVGIAARSGSGGFGQDVLQLLLDIVSAS